MTCNCRADIEAKLKEHFVKQKPDATEHGVTLQGYGFVIMDNTMKSKPLMPYKLSALEPLKKGGTKLKTTTGNMFFNFCPFCGVKV